MSIRCRIYHLRTPNRKDRHEIEALKPGGHCSESSIFQAINVRVQRFWYEAVFDGRAFLSDLKIAVAVRTFEIMMEFSHQMLLGWFVETDLFRQQQGTAWQ